MVVPRLVWLPPSQVGQIQPNVEPVDVEVVQPKGFTRSEKLSIAGLILSSVGLAIYLYDRKRR